MAYFYLYLLYSTIKDFQVLSPSVNAMLEAVALSGSPVKSQQIGDADLTLDQRREELLQQYKRKPLVFLERYQVSLCCRRFSPLDIRYVSVA